MQKGENLQRQICCGGAPPFSGRIQVDAAAKVDGDEGALRRQRSSSDSRGQEEEDEEREE